MRFEQARNIIGHAIEMHKMIETHFSNLAARTPESRIKMISEYLMKREAYLQNGLIVFEETAEKTFNNTWFKFSVCDAKFKQLHGYLETRETNIDAIIDLTVKLYECIVTQFETLAVEAEVDEVRSIFQNIADLEKRELKKLVRNIQMMNEL